MTSDFHYAFGLLNRLEIPYEMNDLKLSLSKCPLSDLLWTLGPYLRDRIQYRPRDSLGLLAYPDLTPFCIRVGDVFEWGDATRVEFFMTVEGTASTFLGEEDIVKLYFDIITQIPQERIVDLTTTLPILRSEELCVQMSNLTTLHLKEVNLPEWFIEPDVHEPYTFDNFLPRLHSISIDELDPPHGDRTPLTNFLTRRSVAGTQITLLSVSNHPPIGRTERLARAVKLFRDFDDNY